MPPDNKRFLTRAFSSSFHLQRFLTKEEVNIQADSHHLRKSPKSADNFSGLSFFELFYDPTILSDGNYIYEGWNVVAEYNLSGSTLTRQKVHYWGPDISGSLQGAGGVGGLVATELEVGTTGTYYTGYPQNGNVTEMLNSTGAHVAYHEDDAFENSINSAGTLAGDFKMRFPTEFREDESSLYYYGYRYYDPNHGRWLNRDPMGEEGGLNL